jgi:hypothetical protein
MAAQQDLGELLPARLSSRRVSTSPVAATTTVTRRRTPQAIIRIFSKKLKKTESEENRNGRKQKPTDRKS